MSARARRSRGLVFAVITLAVLATSPGVGSAARGWVPRCDGTWKVMPFSSPGAILTDVSAISPNDVWAVGSSQSGPQTQPTIVSLAEHWDGTSWSRVTTPNGGTGMSELQAVEARSGNDVWAIGSRVTRSYDRLPFALHWNGSRWTIAHVPDVGGRLLDVVALRREAWAVGGTFGLPKAVTVRRTSAGWQQVPGPDTGAGSQILSSVSALSPTDIWAVGDASEGSGIWRWNGSRWRQRATNRTNDRSSAIAVRSPSNIMVVGGLFGAFWKNGRMWKSVPVAQVPGLDGHLEDVTWDSPTTAWAVGTADDGAADPETIRAYIERWDGSAWTFEGFPLLPRYTSVFNAVSSAGGTTWAVGFGGRNGVLLERYC